jgi:hypothetical protein
VIGNADCMLDRRYGNEGGRMMNLDKEEGVASAASHVLGERFRHIGAEKSSSSYKLNFHFPPFLS